MAVTNTSMWRYDGTMGVDLNGNRVPMPTRESAAAQERDRMARQERSMASHNRLVNIGKIASAVPLAFAAAPMLAGGGAAAAAGSGASTAAGAGSVAGSAFTYGNLLKAAEIGIPAVTNYFGQRSQNRALDRQSQIEQENYAAQMAYAREMEAQRKAEAERMFAEDRRRWEAEERNRARELASTEEERAYRRSLEDARESRRAPYRQAGQDALFRLKDIIGMGRR